MNSKIKTLFEEYLNNTKKSLSVLINYFNDDILDVKTYILFYDKGVYVVFNSIIDCMNFVLYGTDEVYRGYIDEEEFDYLYDNGIDGKFEDKIMWVNNKGE